MLNKCLMPNNKVWYLGIYIKFVVCAKDKVHMWYVFNIGFNFIKKDVMMVKYVK